MDSQNYLAIAEIVPVYEPLALPVAVVWCGDVYTPHTSPAPSAATWDVVALESQTQEVQSSCVLKISDHVHGARKTHGS